MKTTNQLFTRPHWIESEGVIVPKDMQSEMLQVMHSSHLGKKVNARDSQEMICTGQE